MSRHQARELALQVLFQIDVGRADPDTALFEAFTRESDEGRLERLGERDAQFTRDLVQGTWERREALDAIIAKYAKDWALDRMAAIDRNILRLAIYEINHRDDVPASAAADEAVELAKTYSTAESGKFVNGILGTVIRDGKPATEEPVNQA